MDENLIIIKVINNDKVLTGKEMIKSRNNQNCEFQYACSDDVTKTIIYLVTDENGNSEYCAAFSIGGTTFYPFLIVLLLLFLTLLGILLYFCLIKKVNIQENRTVKVRKIIREDNPLYVPPISTYFNPFYQEKLETEGYDEVENHKIVEQNGTLTNGTVTNGTVTNGTVTNGTVTNGTVTNGTVTNGTVMTQRRNAVYKQKFEHVNYQSGD